MLKWLHNNARVVGMQKWDGAENEQTLLEDGSGLQTQLGCLLAVTSCSRS